MLYCRMRYDSPGYRPGYHSQVSEPGRLADRFVKNSTITESIVKKVHSPTRGRKPLLLVCWVVVYHESSHKSSLQSKAIQSGGLTFEVCLYFHLRRHCCLTFASCLVTLYREDQTYSFDLFCWCQKTGFKLLTRHLQKESKLYAFT